MTQEGAPKADLDVNFAGSPPVSDCVSSLPVQEAKGDEPINIMNSVKCLRLTGTKAGQKIPAFGGSVSPTKVLFPNVHLMRTTASVRRAA